MDKNAFKTVLWRTLGGVFGVALLITMAVALNRFVTITGIDLA